MVILECVPLYVYCSFMQLEEKYGQVRISLTIVSFFCQTLEESTSRATKDSTRHTTSSSEIYFPIVYRNVLN